MSASGSRDRQKSRRNRQNGKYNQKDEVTSRVDFCRGCKQQFWHLSGISVSRAGLVEGVGSYAKVRGWISKSKRRLSLNHRGGRVVASRYVQIICSVQCYSRASRYIERLTSVLGVVGHRKENVLSV